MDASEVDGVSIRAMDVELCLPHTTFLNVDDKGVDVEVEMAKKMRVVANKRKQDAEKLAERRASSKRAMHATETLTLGSARGYGANKDPNPKVHTKEGRVDKTVVNDEEEEAREGG